MGRRFDYSHAILTTDMVGRRLRAFTVVELLIVIVVIAVISTVVVVAYVGISDRARGASMGATLKQVAEKVNLWQSQHAGALPVSLAEAGVTNPDNGSYGYRRFDNNAKYCLSYTLQNSSYYVNSTAIQTPAKKSCADPESVEGAVGLLAFNATPNTIASFPAVSGTPDITLYVVFNIIDVSGNYNSIAMLPQSTGYYIQLDTAATDSNQLRYRLDTSAATNVSSSQTGARTTGKHVGWLQVRSGMTVREFAYDKAAAHTSLSLAPGTGWTINGLRLTAANASTQPIAAVVYNAAHDEQTRARVLSWLAATYEVPITF